MNEQDLKLVVMMAYHWGRDNGEGRSEKNLNDFLASSTFQSAVEKLNETKRNAVLTHLDKINKR